MTLSEKIDNLTERVDAVEHRLAVMDGLGPWWQLLLKAHLAVVGVALPFVLGFAIWLTNEIYETKAFRNSGERFSQSDGRQLRDDLRASQELIQTQVNQRFDTMDSEVSKVHRDVDRILVILERQQ